MWHFSMFSVGFVINYQILWVSMEPTRPYRIVPNFLQKSLDPQYTMCKCICSIVVEFLWVINKLPNNWNLIRAYLDPSYGAQFYRRKDWTSHYTCVLGPHWSLLSLIVWISIFCRKASNTNCTMCIGGILIESQWTMQKIPKYMELHWSLLS